MSATSHAEQCPDPWALGAVEKKPLGRRVYTPTPKPPPDPPPLTGPPKEKPPDPGRATADTITNDAETVNPSAPQINAKSPAGSTINLGLPQPSAHLPPLERARLYANGTPGAVSGQGGHAATFALAGKLAHGLLLATSDALIVMMEWNAKCQPPWSVTELTHKVRSTIANPPSKPRGWLLGAGIGPPPQPMPLGPRHRPSRISTGRCSKLY